MAIFHAAFDESGKADREHIVFAGLIATPGPWQKFNEKWMDLISPFGIRYWRSLDAAHRTGQFKCFRESQNDLEKLTLDLADTICEFAEGGSIHTITMEQYRLLPQTRRTEFKDPFYAAFHQGLVGLATGPHVTATDTLTLIYDDAEEYASECLTAYRRLKKLRSDIGDRIVGLCFHDDKHYPPLQAADMFAFVYRLRAEGKLGGIWAEVLQKLDRTFSDQSGSEILV